MCNAMDALGDFGRAFFNALYDYRLPIAIATAIAALAIVVVAWRRGWLAAARRHPGRSTAVAVLALAIGAPLAWYLASPIWIRTSLVEAGPVGSPSAQPVAPPSVASATPQPPSSATPPPAPTSPRSPTPFEPVTVASGEFSGTDDFHFGSGTASIIEVEPGRYHLRLDDFSVRNGPDLYVYVSTAADGYADDSFEVGLLKATDGSFGYDLPDDFDPGRFRSTIIWCKQFSHLFAVAPF